MWFWDIVWVMVTTVAFLAELRAQQGACLQQVARAVTPAEPERLEEKALT
jgi:hypothetical protein